LSDQTFAKEKLYGPVFDYICKHNLYMGWFCYKQNNKQN
jgi:hypothetical protein